MPSSPHRRLTAEREHELYATTLEMLREVGYEALTMDAIATRTHSSKATLYRQWGGKAKLVVAAIHSSKHPEEVAVNTGSFRGDLDKFIGRLAVSGDPETSIMNALGHAMHTNPELKEAFHQVVIEPEREALDAMLRRAVDRGEVEADCPANEFLLHMLIGAVIGQSLVDSCRPDPVHLKRYCESVVLVALGVKPRHPTSHS